MRRGLAVLKSFLNGVKITVGEVEIGLDIGPERGAADSGFLESDLPNLFLAVAEAAQERQTAPALFIDEVQYFSGDEPSALIKAMHKMQQVQLPLVLVGASLPILPGLVGESKSYAERLFSFPDIGPLSETDAAKALRDPRRDAGLISMTGPSAKSLASPRAIPASYRSGVTKHGIARRRRLSQFKLSRAPRPR